MEEGAVSQGTWAPLEAGTDEETGSAPGHAGGVWPCDPLIWHGEALAGLLTYGAVRH